MRCSSDGTKYTTRGAGVNAAAPGAAGSLGSTRVVWVLRGSLVIVDAGERHLLGTGDCLGFGAPAEVTFANETASPCEYLVALARN